MLAQHRRSVFCLALALLCGPHSIHAQTGRTDVSAAYVYMRDPTVDVNFAAGWNVGASTRVHDWLSVAAEVDDSRTTIPTVAGGLRLSVLSVMAGGRASAKLGRATEFGQVLLGAARASGSLLGVSEANTHLATLAGAGVDVRVRHHVAVRVELDYRVVLNSRLSELGHQVRVLTGAVFTVF